MLSDKEKLALGVTAAVAGFLANKLMETGYKQVFKEDAPNTTKRADEKEDMTKLLVWTVVSGITVSLLKDITKKGIGRFMRK